MNDLSSTRNVASLEEQLSQVEAENAALRAENAQLAEALEASKVIDRAKHLLMTKYRWSEDAAYRYMQRQAMDQRVPMVELANAVIDQIAKHRLGEDMFFVPGSTRRKANEAKAAIPGTDRQGTGSHARKNTN